MGIKQVSDGFIWKTIDKEEASKLFISGFPVYELLDDESESLIDTLDDLVNSDSCSVFGIEVGRLCESD